MKKVIAVATLIGFFFITIAFTLPKNRCHLKLEPGLYAITNDQGSEFELNQTGKFYDVQKVPLINIKHITSTRVGVTPRINGKTYSTLTFNLDSIGIDAINRIKGEQEIGLILNNKLRSVAKYVSFGSFTGPSIHIQGTSADSPEEFEALKKDIDASH